MRIVVESFLVLFCTTLPLGALSANTDSPSFGLCSNNSDCYPADLNGSSIPSAYVNCSNQKCACSECFYATNSYRSCAYQRCWMYEGTTQTCIDLRKEQSTAFFLSLLLSAVGAANFYIERYDLGGAQLSILLWLPVALLLLLGLNSTFFCWLKWIYGGDDLTVHECFELGCRNSCICLRSRGCRRSIQRMTCIWILLMVMWWVADIVTFAEDIRMAGNGCPLKHRI